MFFSFIFMGIVKELLLIDLLNTVRIFFEDTSVDLGL